MSRSKRIERHCERHTLGARRQPHASLLSAFALILLARGLSITTVSPAAAGASSGVQLRDNHVHSMGNYKGTLGSFDVNAVGADERP